MFKKGNTVVMHSCGEAEHYAGKLWTCTGDSFLSSSKEEVVFLDGFSGSFLTKYLQVVTLPQSEQVEALTKELEQHKRSVYIDSFIHELSPNYKGEIPLRFNLHGVEHALGITESDARTFNHLFKMNNQSKNS